jgi:hypothetical protein
VRLPDRQDRPPSLPGNADVGANLSADNMQGTNPGYRSGHTIRRRLYLLPAACTFQDSEILLTEVPEEVLG